MKFSFAQTYRRRKKEKKKVSAVSHFIKANPKGIVFIDN